MTSIFKGESNYIIEAEGKQYQTPTFSMDELFQSGSPNQFVTDVLAKLDPLAEPLDLGTLPWQAPVERQEVWAAGVTYFRSRTARMEEAETAGGDIFYDKVYDAERPEIFFKATAGRCRGHQAGIRIREDSTWDVPEPELTLAINSQGKVFGYTIGNDVSSRSIEGENPLYLPQAKVYKGSCALGPCLVVGESAVDATSSISISIERAGELVFEGQTEVSQIKRGFKELAEFLFRDNEFPEGALLMTGTGVVPDSNFTLRSGDCVRISIDGLGKLENTVE